MVYLVIASFRCEVGRFDGIELVEATLKADLIAHRCRQERLHQRDRDRFTYYSSADAQHVHVIMFYALRGGIGVVTD